MRFIYNCFVYFASFLLKLAANFSPKLRLFVEGRKNVFSYLEKHLSPDDQIIWLHAASLGEFEQGLPILEGLKKVYKNHCILVTFFSPSGFEVKKNTKAADLITYLPLDTAFNAQKFVQVVHPSLAIFVKYEIWPNYLATLKKEGIPALLVSAIFNKTQIFFKFYGGYMKKSLGAFTHFFVQDEISKKLLNQLGFQNVRVSGDTRFDRVLHILTHDNRLDFMEQFKGSSRCLVAGSTWPEDERVLTAYINDSDDAMKFIFAPHTIQKEAIEKLRLSITKKVLLYSELSDCDIAAFDVLIIDTIGILTKVYSYADFAYVGGGFATGLHNTLEPAVFGIPVFIGPAYKGFKEAEDLVAVGGVIPISNTEEFSQALKKFLNSEPYYLEVQNKNNTYIQSQRGATDCIVKYILKII